MNSRERVQAAFDKRQPDRVPVCHIGFSSGVASALLGREAYVGGGIQQWREAVALWNGPDAHVTYLERSYRDAVDIAMACGHDILRVTYWRYAAQPTRRLDENTFLYEHGPESDWRVLRYDPESEQCHVFDYRPKPELVLEDLERRVDEQERAVANYQPSDAAISNELRALREYGGEYIVRVGGVGIEIPAETAWLQAALLRPDLVARFLDAGVERARCNVQFLASRGFRHLFGGGDLGTNSGPVYSPRIFHELLLPRIQRISEICHQAGCYHLFASDGNLWSVADDLFERSGVDGYLEIDRRAGMDLVKLRERFPKLTMIGNISSHTVHTGTRAEVVAEARACMAEAKRCGGVIAGTSNYFVPGTPIANVRAVIETVLESR